MENWSLYPPILGRWSEDVSKTQKSEFPQQIFSFFYSIPKGALRLPLRSPAFRPYVLLRRSEGVVAERRIFFLGALPGRSGRLPPFLRTTGGDIQRIRTTKRCWMRNMWKILRISVSIISMRHCLIDYAGWHVH